MKHLAPIFRGKIKRGTLVIDNKKVFDIYLTGLNGKKVEVVIRRPGRHRSLKQNAYYWGVVVAMISHEMGEIIPEETHGFLREMFLKKGVDVRGKRYQITRSTSDLTTQEFSDYVEKCRIWAASELNINIPLPNEVDLN